MSSEELLGITPPPEYQCANIDEYIKEVDKLLECLVKGSDNHDFDEITYGATFHASYLEGNFEDLRHNIELVRDWGNGWKTLAKELIEMYEPELLEDKLEE